MTCIVGLVHKDKVYMGGDSCGSSVSSWTYVGNPKVFKVQNKFLIGCTSSFRMIDLLTHKLNVQREHPDDSDDLFMRTTFIEGVRNCLKEGGFAKTSAPESGGNFLVGYNGKLYEVQGDYSILNCPDWGSSVGSGEGPARGSLWTTRNDKDPKKRVQIALEAAEAVVPSVRGPMVILDM